MQGLTDLQRSRTNLSVPLSAYLQLSLPGGGNNDKRSAPPASSGSFRHWQNPKFALTLVYLLCLPWGPRGRAIPQLGRRGKGIQYHSAEPSCSLGPCWRMDGFKSSLAACRNTNSAALSETGKIQASTPAVARALSSLHAFPQAVAALRCLLAALRSFYSSAFSESGTGFFFFLFPPKKGRQLHQPSSSANSFAILSFKARLFWLDLSHHQDLQSEFWSRRAGQAEPWPCHCKPGISNPTAHLLRLFIPWHNSPILSTYCLLSELFCLQYFVVFDGLCSSVQPTLSAPFLHFK